MKYIKYIYIKIYFFICNPKEILPKKIKSGYLWVTYFLPGALHVHFPKYLTLTCIIFVIEEKLLF